MQESPTRIAIPSAAFFLVAAAVASDLFPGLTLSIPAVERIGTVALIVILFDGGSSIGLRRFRVAAIPIATLGILGTFATAGVLTLFVHWVFGLSWIASGLLGAAIAPTDPAVMFSVLGGHDIAGRSGTILEGESGANDPVGIALMLGLIELARHADASFWIVVRVFCEQISIGLAFGIAGGLLERMLIQRVRLPYARLHVLRTLALAGVVYGAAAVSHGSGFLAVFVAGLIVGDMPRAFEPKLARLAEVVVFVALGLTVSLGSLDAGRWAEGLAIAGFTAFVARPLVTAPLLIPTTLQRGEILFVMWGGLKGAVPILLAAFALGRHVRDSQQIYELVFVIVLASVVVQGSTIGLAAQRLLRRRASRAASVP